ncbi:MAG: hypothetical protein J6Y82_02755 [Bacteroidales bacterium]|nr:hypothetical protein [Bacteroidales bacterium]
MNEELRKVTFDLNEQNLFIGDISLDFKDKDGILKRRHGLFYRFGDKIVYDSEQEKSFQKTVAIVEEIATGKIYEVAPERVKFVKK